MYLTHLSLTNFRNFTRLDVDVPSGPVLLVGSNAQGKTSLLESVYFLATFVSFHAGSERELVNFLAAREPLAVTRIVADYSRSKTVHRLEVRVIQESEGSLATPRVRKEILLDGVKRKAGEVVGAFNAVLFLPQMLRVVDGPPEERRRYINLAISQVNSAYAAALGEYNQILGQRNALLKQLSERGGDPSQLSFWDEQLSIRAALLIQARARAFQELESLLVRYHHDLTRSQEVLRLNYLPSYDPLPQVNGQIRLPMDVPVDRSSLALDHIAQGFIKCLRARHAEDTQRGITTAGPHRDEFRFLANGIDLGTYGSRGQARTAVLSLKLAEVAWMKEKTGEWPVMLLDEVLAELDAERRSDLLARLSSCEQGLLTTTDLDLFSHSFIEDAKVWRIKAGRFEEVDNGE